MVYKLINEWKGNNDEHEITIYKYNYNHDEMVRYNKTQGSVLTIKTLVATKFQYEETYDLRDGEKKWWNYNTMKVEN